MEKKYKVYVVGGGNYAASWFTCENKKIFEFTNLAELADIAVFTGGSDINPEFYGQKKLKCTYDFPERDNYEKKMFYFFKKKGTIMIGICRGFQLINSLSGGDMYQDIRHYGGHDFYTHDGNTFKINSLHHQLVKLDKTPRDLYRILGWSPGSSYYVTDKESKQNEGQRDVEAAYYPKTKGFGVQFHPEMMSDNSPVNKWLREQLTEIFNINFTNNKTNVRDNRIYR